MAKSTINPVILKDSIPPNYYHFQQEKGITRQLTYQIQRFDIFSEYKKSAL